MIPFLAFGIAAAAPPAVPETQAQSTHDRWASMNDLTVEPALVRPVEKPVVLTLGPERLELTGGWVIPVFSGHLAGEWERHGKELLATQSPGAAPRLPSKEERGDQVVVGFVWTGGTGRIAVALDDRADAQTLANRMVLDLGEDRSAWAPVARGEAPATSGVDDVIVLGVDPALVSVFLDEKHPDPYEIVVYGDSDAARKAAAHAKDLFDGRARMWDDAEIGRGDRVAWDRLGQERGVVGRDGTYTVWEARTAIRWGLLSPAVGGDNDHWLAVARDSTGEVDQRRLIRVSALGVGVTGAFGDLLIAGVPHPLSVSDDPTSAPVASQRVEAVLAESTILVTPISAGTDLKVTIDSDLTFRAVGGPAASIDLRFPKMDRVPGSFRIVTAELADGTPLLGRSPEDVKEPPPPEPKPRPPGPEPPPEPEPLPEPGETQIRLLLPVNVASGQTVVVHVVHEDTWPCNQFLLGPGGVTSLGRSSGIQGFLPAVSPQQLSAVWPFRARVAVPLSGRLVATLSGRTVEEGEENGWEVTRVDSEGHAAWFPSVAVGQFQTVDDPAQLGFPAVRVRTFTSHFGTNEQFAPEIRRIIGFYEGWLPPYPVREVEVFESPRAVNSLRWVAPYGMVNIQLMMDTRAVSAPLMSQPDRSSSQHPNVRNDRPHFENGIVAHEIAHQYWGHLEPPASIEDFWIAESFSELFSCLYLSAAFDAQDCQVRMADKRQSAESFAVPTAPWSLTRAYSSNLKSLIVYDYGPYVLGEMLIRRIGREPFFAAMDVMLREHPNEPLTTERVEAYLEAASGKDLHDFFDFWIHVARLPAITLTWEQQGAVVSGTVTSNVPFGTFDVPVVVRSGDAVSTAWVTVTDGSGNFRLDTGRSDAAKPALDPENYVLATKKSVQKVR